MLLGLSVRDMVFLLCIFTLLFGALYLRRTAGQPRRAAPYREPLVPEDFWESCPDLLQSTDPPVVVWIVRDYLPDFRTGAVTMAHELNRFLIRQAGWQVVVLTPEPSVTSYEDVLIVPFHQDTMIRAVLRRAHCILTQYQVIETAALTAKHAHKPLVLVTHDDSMNPWIDKVKGICGNSVSLVNNSEWLDTLYRFQGLPSCVIYPPVFWKEYRVNSTRQYVTLVNCNKNKGVETFYEIARRMSHVEFLAVAGAYGDQIPPPADLQNVRGLRHQADIRSVFAQTGILCVPSEKESWGKTALEAAASGIPVLAHPTAGLKEALGPDGIYCNRENVEAWVREIQKLLDSPLAYEKASRAIYRRVVSLDPTQQLEEFRAFLLDRRWVG